MAHESPTVSNFIHDIIDEDLTSGKHKHIYTRFPPEPNGFLHVGHAKSICLNFGTAEKYQGRCNLRFDDTNPEKESQEYIDAIKRDVTWLGYQWDSLHYASDYFESLYEAACTLIKLGKAYVCDLSADQVQQYRGSLTEPGKNSPYRERSVDENLELFQKMRAGSFADGACTLRAKIDMSSGNINLRDPAIYRIRRAHHHRTGDAWCIYPMYDFTHCLSDAYEQITHSLCTLEFEDHRPLYDWFLEALSTPARPRQIEFARLDLNYTVTSKRKLGDLVARGLVSGWDDPRMPTIGGMRRRGFTPESIRNFCNSLAVTKRKTTIDMSILEDALRNDLNDAAARAMCVLRPLKVVIESFPEDESLPLEAPCHPQKPEMGLRTMAFTREIYIDREDFLEEAPKKFFRLAPGREVRLRNSFVIKCEKVIKDNSGEITELRCSHDPDTLGKNPEGRKVKGIIHWVSAVTNDPIEVRLYDRMFEVENPGKSKDMEADLNKGSLEVLYPCYAEKGLSRAEGPHFQFERVGYFTRDPDSTPDKPVFNRSVTLRDGWAKVNKE